MNRRRRFASLAVVAALLLAGGCAKDDPPADIGPSPAPDDLMLQVRVAGGLLPVTAFVTELPAVSVYGDGRVITDGPVPDIYPGPALPNVQVQHISPADVSKLVRMALDAGVGRQLDLGMPHVADAPTTTIMARTASGLKVTDAPALGIAEDSLTAAQRSARQKLRELIESLTDLPKTLGAGAVDEARPFTPSAVAVVAIPWADSGADPGLPSPPPQQAWPGPALPGAPLPNRTMVNCVTATGAQAEKVLNAARTANARTPWTSGGETWSVTLRPLLPHETGCDDLGR